MKRGLSAESPNASAQLVDGRVQAVVEIYERIRRPVLVPQLLTRHHFARSLQHRQYAERLFLQLDALALLAQFSRTEIDLEGSKPQVFFGQVLEGHAADSLPSEAELTCRLGNETVHRSLAYSTLAC